MAKKFYSIPFNTHTIQFLELPNTNVFRFEIVQKQGSNLERNSKKNMYGLTHFVEHLSFKSTKDYSSTDLIKTLKKHGEYNASTDYHRVDYHYLTTSNKMNLAMNLVCNIALNDLKLIHQEEFIIEKNVVINEINRYNDDSQGMFVANIFNRTFGLKKEDNLLGTEKILKKCTLEDAIEVKNIFLKSPMFINIAFDPLVLNKETILEQLTIELKRWNISHYLPLNEKKLIQHLETITVKKDTEQSMASIVFDSSFLNLFYLKALAEYVNYYSETSLNEYIREKHGLTYGVVEEIFFDGEKNYITFFCDVNEGAETLLESLFTQSLHDSYTQLSQEKFEEFKETILTKIALNTLNQEEYFSLFETMILYPSHFNEYKNILESDVDNYEHLSMTTLTYDVFKNKLETLLLMLKNKEYTFIKNY